MKRIALVQNQSEMANYSHADCRGLLTSLGYSYVLFTANSIETLDDQLASGIFDCLLLASNSLQDKVIRQFFDTEPGRHAVGRFLQGGGGLVVLMQYKAAYDNYSFDFVLPGSIAPIAKQRPVAESALTSAIQAVKHKNAPPLLRYPSIVNIEKLKNSSLDHPTLPGVYWHWWNANLISSWNTHLVCTIEGDPRPLLITTQEHLGIRAVMSALPIDWHSHSDLFDNIILYACEGRHHAASISNRQVPEPSLEYLTAKLKARKVGLREYDLLKNVKQELFDNIESGIHNTLLLDPSLDLDRLFSEDQTTILRQKLMSGELRTISLQLEPNAWETSVHIRGRRNPAQEAYQMLIPRISQELLDGYLDGSFRSTISGLQDLEHLPYGLDLDVFPVTASIETAQKHDRDGSYDEVIGATSGLLWLRAKVQGSFPTDIGKTVGWLRNRISRVDPRERIYALCILEDVGLATDEDRALAASTLRVLSAVESSELELIAFLTGAVKFKQEQTMLEVLGEFSRRSKNGGGPLWVDTPTTASLVRLLVDAHARFPVLSASGSEPGVLLRDLVIPAMVVIETDYERTIARSAEIGYPWDGKASTALRCLSAWYRFEQYLKAPVDEAAGAVLRASQGANLTTLADGAVGSLRVLLGEYGNLKVELVNQNEQLESMIGAEKIVSALSARLVRAVHIGTWATVAFSALLYLYLDHFIRKYWFNELLGEIGSSIPKNWAQHTAVVMFLVAVLAVPWAAVWSALAKVVEGRSKPNG